jgi:hypothetical protein
MSKNIDKLFKDKFKESKATAPTEAWPVIQAKLKMIRNIRLLYMFSILGVLSLISFMLFSTHTEKTLSKPLLKNTSLKNEVILKDNDVKEVKEVKEVKDVDVNKDKLPVSKPQEDSKKLYATITTKKESKNNTTKFLYKNNTKTSKKTPFFKNKFGYAISEKVVKGRINLLGYSLDSLDYSVKKNLKAERKKRRKKKDSIEVEKFNNEKRRRWNVIPVFGISNSGRLSKNVSTLGTTRAVTYPDKYFDDNKSSGLISSIYGFNVVFRATNRISIQTGIFSKELRFLTEDLFLSEFIPDVNPTNIIYNPGVEVRFSNTPDIVGSESVSLSQSILYMEMPFEFKYRMFGDSKFNTNVVVGFSFLYLNKNEIRAKSNTSSRSIGKAGNLLTTSTSLNIGLDVEYHLSKRLVLNSAVMFKKHYNTYKDYNNEYSPYTFGMHVGIGYKF